jgi:glycosyltransferase involved in cell wall biosynthesis
MSSLVINHVMSQDIQSGILDSFIHYLSEHSPDKHVVTLAPMAAADVHHYHRPHLEKRLLKNSVTTVHHDLGENDPWLPLITFLARYKECQRVVCLNQGQSNLLREHRIKGVTVVPHGYHDDIFSSPKHRRHSAKKKLTLALISKRYGRRVKGESYFQELVKRLDQRFVDFILVGDGRQVEHQFLSQLGFDSRLYERLPYRVFGDLYREIDLLLMLSLYEGGPANVPEAMASNVPVAGFSVGMVPDWIEDNENGLILSGNVDKDAARIMVLAQDPKQYQSLFLNTVAHALTLPSWRRVGEHYQRVYREVVEEVA